MKVSRIMLAGTSSGCGKTTVTCALLMALKKLNIRVSCCKCGPDYIDPMFHTRVIGIPSTNLDLFFSDKNTVNFLLAKQATEDITVVEGVMGFYDGMQMDSDRGSSYHLSKATKTPVILVVNGKGSALTVCAVINGMTNFREDSSICGVILNNISKSVYDKLAPVITQQTKVRVLGYLPTMPDAAVESRHLGLITPQDIEDINSRLEMLGDKAIETFDIKSIVKIAKESSEIALQPMQRFDKTKVKIAVARDAAFCFYYKDNIDMLVEMGAEIVYFSPLVDKELPKNIDGIIFGGGYPELYADSLSSNKSMLKSVKKALNSGMPCLAECGGFMYLQEKLINEKGEYKMTGFLKGTCRNMGRLCRFGYITLHTNISNDYLSMYQEIKAHEFHYYDSSNNGEVFTAVKPDGKRKWDCMVLKKNTLAGFPHIYYYSNPQFAKNFIDKCYGKGDI